ncbi:hypothetical protein V6N13_040124 [Hibiscus sabdariffa]
MESARMDVKRILGVDSTSNLERYLGLPPMVGREKKMAFLSLRDKMVSRSQGWSIWSLSQGGKEVFVNFVPRSGNSVAHILAKDASLGSAGSFWVEEVPGVAWAAVAEDRHPVDSL